MNDIGASRPTAGVADDRSVGTAPRVAVVLVNWNGREDTLACLESLRAVRYPAVDVVVVDNGSTDGSGAAIETAHPEVTLLKNGRNLGFTGGCNAGIAYALERLSPQYLLFLNNDTVVDPNFITELVRVAEADPTVGAASAKVYFYDEPDRIWALGGAAGGWKGIPTQVGHRERDVGQFARVIPLDFTAGCAMLVPAALMRRLGPFHEPYFAYFEDEDWCMRAARAGFRSVLAPGSVVWHKVGRTGGTPVSPNHVYLMTRNNLLYLVRNVRPRWRLPATVLLNVAWRLHQAARYLLRGEARERRLAQAILTGLVDGALGRYGPPARQW